ncbi:MAG: aldo/keto reductase [Candidatus Aminicenantes bacterium]|nr:MAG: aldo/keto reductase [Candidatus Aminicenantes bacterium]
MKQKRMKRRDFIGKAAFGFLSAGISIPIARANLTDKNQSYKIIYRTLGRTRLRIPIVSFGVMNSDSPDLINKALDIGINHLDTAHLYLRGNSERAIGEVLHARGSRDKVYLATKMRFARDRERNIFSLRGNEREPAATEENLFRQLETSLKRLRTDYIDILYLHSCYSPQMAVYEPLMNALVKVKKQGKARFIGISTHKDEANVILAAVKANVYDVVLTAYNFVQKNREELRKAIQYAADKGVGVVAMKTQGGRQLQEEGKVEINHEAALKWVLSDENVCTTIPGMTTFSQLEQNFKTMSNLTLSEAEQKELQFASKQKGILYCQYCRNCIATCPKSVEIPTLMRSYMYMEGYGNLIQAQLTTAELPKNQGLNVCLECSSCTAICPNGISINSRLRYLIAEKMYLV